MFIKTFGCCRKVYNLMLADKIAYFNSTGTMLYNTPAGYKTDYPYLKEVDSLALANVQLNLQSAYKNCFDKKRKKRNGFPKFKSRKNSRQSYTTNNQKGTVSIVDNKAVKLPKVGLVKAKIHRIPGADWLVKSATVSRESDGSFYISVLFEFKKMSHRYRYRTMPSDWITNPMVCIWTVTGIPEQTISITGSHTADLQKNSAVSPVKKAPGRTKQNPITT